jgi:hypothetical protein
LIGEEVTQELRGHCASAQGNVAHLSACAQPHRAAGKRIVVARQVDDMQDIAGVEGDVIAELQIRIDPPTIRVLAKQPANQDRVLGNAALVDQRLDERMFREPLPLLGHGAESPMFFG